MEEVTAEGAGLKGREYYAILRPPFGNFTVFVLQSNEERIFREKRYEDDNRKRYNPQNWKKHNPPNDCK
jgi:hypothetical protein